LSSIIRSGERIGDLAPIARSTTESAVRSALGTIEAGGIFSALERWAFCA